MARNITTSPNACVCLRLCLRSITAKASPFPICGHVGNGIRFEMTRDFRNSRRSRKQFANNAKSPRIHARANAPSCCSDGSSRAYFIVNRSRMPKTPLTHHLVALWFADIAGYSDRAAEDERSALQLIEILQSLSRDTVRRYEGRVVKFMGDAVLAEFTSTELGVRAAAALSEEYVEQS